MTTSSDDGGTAGNPDARSADGLSVPPTLFGTLSTPARRHALSVLSEVSDPIGVGDLTTRVADRLEEDTSDRAFEVEVLHVHLPALSDAGLVEWHQADGLVSETVRGASLAASEEQ